jgi:ribonucleoside-diphosphate reductase alpha subunit
MYVIKRDGREEKVSFDKITTRIGKLCYNLNKCVDPLQVAEKVRAGIHKGVRTSELDELTAEEAVAMSCEHPDYGTLGARISISNLQKETKSSFVETATILYTYVDAKSGLSAPLLSETVYDFILEHKNALESAISYDRDYLFDYFGLQTLKRSHLLRVHDKVIERPQHMWMRVACGLHCGKIENVLETYHLMSNGYFTHASPTLFNAGTPHAQLSSCFLMVIKGDDIGGIFDTVKNCALISKQAGGIGLCVDDIRACGDYIRGTNGRSNGIVPMLQVFNATARYVDQGGGKRPGAFAIYMEPWHCDIESLLELRKNHGVASKRARDLFYGLWVPDLFMKRIKEDGKWSLFSPIEAPLLSKVWGKEFEDKYQEFEAKGKARKVIRARALWKHILDTQQETGLPYILFKDSCNAKSNQKHLGTIRCSNLCTEIVQYSSPTETAVCNLASIALPKYVNVETQTFDHEKLSQVVQVVVKNNNRIIDINDYPLPETRVSNLRHRPMGIGVQGLADTFLLLGYPFESKEAEKLNVEIFETMYFAALTASVALAEKEGPYETYEGSPMSQGLLQFDLWGVDPTSDRWDWKELRNKIKKFGVRNSLLIAPMPTATTSQILGNNESFEPYTSNLYTRRTTAGTFVCFNKHLVRDLIKLDLWTPVIKNQLIAKNGSIQDIKEIPESIRKLYKTVWEIPGRVLIDLSAARAPFICQSQSLNSHMSEISYEKLNARHFYAWEKGLKTCVYYVHSQPAADAFKVTVDMEMLKRVTKELEAEKDSEKEEREEERDEEEVCVKKEGCISCSS